MIDTAGDGVRVSRSMVFKWHTRFWDGWMSINDDEKPVRPTEIGDAMIDDIRQAVQEGVHAPFLSFSSLGSHRALKCCNFSFSVKIICIFDMNKSYNSNISITAILPSSCTIRRSTVVMQRHF